MFILLLLVYTINSLVKFINVSHYDINRMILIIQVCYGVTTKYIYVNIKPSVIQQLDAFHPHSDTDEFSLIW